MCMSGIVMAQTPAFDVVTIKPSKTAVGGMGLGRSTPDGVEIINSTAKSLIANAYDLKADYIHGGPGWVDTAEYDVTAKVLPGQGAVLPHLDVAQIKRMMKAMLADRFQLVVHEEVKELPVLELTVIKGGVKLHEAAPGDTYPNGLKYPDGKDGIGMMIIQDGVFTAQAVPIANLVDTLSLVLHGTVVDKTGLLGKYDISLPLPREENAPPGAGVDTAVLYRNLEEQLGLKLHAAKGPVRTLVIDHIERPSEN